MSQAALNARDREVDNGPRRSNGTQLAGMIFLLMVLGTVVWSGWAVLGWMKDASRLPLSRLVVTGERHYTTNDDIRQAILALGAPGTFMTQDVDVIQQQIERLPWIKQASVRKQWPDELKIHLVEYVPVARWNDLHMVDAEGKAFSVPAERAGKQKLPLLYGPEGSEQDVLEGYRAMSATLAASKYTLKMAAIRCVSFGADVGDYHLNRQQGETWLRVRGEKVLNTREMKLTGRHNYTNALAALALADAVNIPRASSLKALTTFTGLAHRFQLAWEHNGVRWINDSKATNVGSTEAALNGLQVDGTLHLLLGGDGKSADFSPLARYLQGDNVRLYCFGRDGAQLAQLRPEVATLTETMEQAMRTIAGRVMPGDMVLLSPACASLDQFRNFEVRGDEFARLAQELGG